MKALLEKMGVSLVVSMLLLTGVNGQHMHMYGPYYARKNVFLLMMDSMMIKMAVNGTYQYTGSGDDW